MRLSIVTGVCGALDITCQWWQETIGRCETQPEVVVIANGCTEQEIGDLSNYLECSVAPGRAVLQGFPDPLGSTRTFNEGLKRCSGDVVAMLHNDLMVYEVGWDRLVLDWFRQNAQCGVAGFHGSTMLADAKLYQVPYQLQNLGRGDSYSNLEDAEHHGARYESPKQVVTVDGMALIARRQDLLDWGGLDESYTHHMYDHDLCTTARAHGKGVWMLPIRARHISGQTANAPRYNEHFAGAGRDQGIHAAAHQRFYEKWKGSGLIPARLP